MNELMLSNQEGLRINSVDLVDIINQFRQLESELIEDKKYKELRHRDFTAKIKRELETLETLGLSGARNISQSSYRDNQGKTQPCYSLNRDGMLQMLNSESVLVRHKTIEYINKLEDENKQLKKQLDVKAQLLLSIYNGGQEGILACKELTEIEVKEATKPLLDEIEENRPLVDFSNRVANTSDLIDMGQFSKLVRDENIKLGRNKLFEWLRTNGFLMRNNEPYERYIKQGIFKLKEYTYNTPYGEKIGTKVYVSGKGQLYLIEKLRKEFCNVA